MQTFLPYSDFKQSAAVLDWRRLGKQRVEAFQIIRAITIPTYGWQNHPAVKMWRGYEDALGAYMNACIEEWVGRGYKNTMERIVVPPRYAVPGWIGDETFHASHRAALLRKDPVWYGQFGWVESVEMEYVWPVG